MCGTGNENAHPSYARRRWRARLLTTALTGGMMGCAGMFAAYLHSGKWRAVLGTGLLGFLLALAVGLIQSLYRFVRITICDLIQGQSWEQVGTSPAQIPFHLDGLDVWQHEWRHLNVPNAVVLDDEGNFCRVQVYEIVSGEKRLVFGADEYANGGWSFFQIKQRGRTWRKPGMC